MPAKIPKVSRIYEIPVTTKKKSKKIKSKTSHFPADVSAQKDLETKHDILSKLIYAKLYFLNKGKYKKYKQAKINYAEYASKNYEAVKTLPKDKIPQVSIWGFSPLLPLYAIRYARILITDMFRKKTPAEKELIKLAKEEMTKNKLKIKDKS